MKYVKKFNTYSAYQIYTSSNNFIQPNVSLCIDTDETYCTSPTGTTYKITDSYHGHEYIEIGGLKWATKNVGANNITDTGFFFHWGDTQGYTTQQCINGEMTSNYKYYNINASSVTEEYANNYCNYNNGRTSGNMLSSDDAAKSIMHGNWRIPTPEEWQSLITNTDISFTTNYNNTNVPGYILTDKLDNTKTLFIPAIEQYQGWYNSGSSFPYPIADNSYGTYYWTTAWTENSGYAQSFFYYGDDGVTKGDGYDTVEIQYGLPIRAVAN